MENNTTEGYLKQISDSLKNGKAAVLIGAGFSKNAEKSIQSAPDFPLWNDLGNAFYNKLYPNASEKKCNYTNPLDLAEQIEVSFGRPVLDNLLIKLIPDLQYKPFSLHKKLLELPWTDIFTTNYDTLLERASCDVIENRFRIISCKEDLTSGAEVPRIIKLHGTFPSYRPFIITTEDYRTYPHQFAPFVNTVQQSLLENTFCLIGFSGNDPNFLSWIGWIHDNLGIENSPYMYLLVHHPMPEVQRKLLYKKRIITVDISSLTTHEGASVRDKYESLLDYFLNDVSTIKDSWIKDKSLDFTDSNFNQITSELACLHEQYPGWIIPPYRERSMMNMSFKIRKTLINLKKQEENKELSFLYEYNWLREQCLHPLCDDEAEIYKIILNRHSSNNCEESHLIVSLLLSLLQQTRENSNNTEWIDLSQKICDQQHFMNDDEKNAFIYEQCLFDLFHFEYEKLNKRLDKWANNMNLPLRMIQKTGLLGECGRLEEADNLIRDNLISIRCQLQSNDDDCFLLSCESICISMSGFIRAAKKIYENNENDKREIYEDNVNKKRNAVHHKYQCSWRDENEKFLQLMEVPYIPDTIMTTEPSFDFGYKHIRIHFGEDENFINACAFLHFRENTGYPFRVFNVVNGTNAAKGAAQRIAKECMEWAIVTLVRANEEEKLKKLFNRVTLSTITVEQIDDMCNTCLGILNKIEPWLVSKVVTTYNFAEQAARVLPVLLSFFCCKCRDEILVKILQLLLMVYKSEHRLVYGNMSNLVSRLMSALSKKQIADNFDTILKFPIINNRNSWYPDPIECIDYTLIAMKIKASNFEPMFKLAQQGDIGSTNRIIWLALNGALSDHQKADVGELIWHNNNLNLLLFYRDAYLDLPCAEPMNCKNILTSQLLLELTEMSKSKNISSKMNDLFTELKNCILKKLFNTKEILMIIFNCEELVEHYIIKLQKNENVFSKMIDLKDFLYQISIILMDMFMCYPKMIITDNEKTKLDATINIINKQHMCHPLLLILWNKKLKNNINEKEILIEFLIYGFEYQKMGVYSTLFIFVKNYKLNKTINCNTFLFLLTIIIDQVIWNNEEYKALALDVFTCTIQNLNTTISKAIFDKLLQGLRLSIGESKITEKDTEEEANRKGLLRIAAARLANEIIKFYDSQNKEIPQVLKKWEDICKDPNEFVEVRRTMNN